MTERIDTSGTPGAVARPTYMHRSSRVYAVYENELGQISTWNTLSTAFFSACTFCGSFALSLSVSDKMDPTSTPDGKAIVALGVPVGGCVAGLCLVLAIWALCKKGGTLKTIRSESRECTPDGLAPAAK